MWRSMVEENAMFGYICLAYVLANMLLNDIGKSPVQACANSARILLQWALF